jgi:hypothetical protein
MLNLDYVEMLPSIISVVGLYTNPRHAQFWCEEPYFLYACWYVDYLLLVPRPRIH